MGGHFIGVRFLPDGSMSGPIEKTPATVSKRAERHAPRRGHELHELSGRYECARMADRPTSYWFDPRGIAADFRDTATAVVAPPREVMMRSSHHADPPIFLRLLADTFVMRQRIA